MSSSTQSARRSAPTTSYTYGIPGSQVTINLKNNGNHTLTLSRGSNTNSKPFCKVCYDAGLPVADYTDHYVKDQPGPNGKVVCPTLLAQKCLMCGVAGHTSSYCPEEMRREREQKERERDARRVSTCDANGWKVVGSGGAVVNSKSKPRIEAPSAQVTASRGVYGLLAVDDADSESDHEHENKEEKMPASVPKAAAAVVEPAKPMTWAQRAAAAATKMPSPSTSTLPSSRSAAPVTDTRFQLNYLCNQIEVSRRAPSAKKAPAANHRANAAEVARESSLKRKQESVTIPA
jgi:hypothetical protein